MCANRLYVQDGVYDAFAEKLIAAMKRPRVGQRSKPVSHQGPLIDEAAVEKVRSICRMLSLRVPAYCSAGNAIVWAVRFLSRPYSRTFSCKMKVAREETFGPVAPAFQILQGRRCCRVLQRHRIWAGQLFLQPGHRSYLARC